MGRRNLKQKRSTEQMTPQQPKEAHLECRAASNPPKGYRSGYAGLIRTIVDIMLFQILVTSLSRAVLFSARLRRRAQQLHGCVHCLP